MKKSSLMVACIIGMGLSGAVLMLLVPLLFSSDGQGNIWIMGALGVLFLAFTAGARYCKPFISAAGTNG
ncbi:hypothetical protein [Paeniglutamicibacter antarcticus]|uniref:Uncharacterized protein n=1 Tax=Paeniglutamicibacter antarcticus TaxID=494023 RepID=A0ABP9TJK7_9MICC